MPASGIELADASPFRSGVVLGGRYRLLSRVGTGSMGEVWRAEHVSLGTIAAVKVLDASHGSDGRDRLLRFQQEARAAARLKSPHIVHVLDHGVDGNFGFMAMELLHGESLFERLVRCRRLPLAEVSTVITGMARGLSLAHAAGILHRDLKPANVFLVQDAAGPLIKLLDFGIAKVTFDRADIQVQTHEGRVLGTPSYMSPEQVRGYELDARSDLWAVGVIAFECMVGRRPFDGPTLGDTFLRVCSGQVPPPSLIAEVPPGFDEWIAKALSFEREDRFASATEMAEALAALVKPAAALGLAPATTAEVAMAPPPPPPVLTSSAQLAAGRSAWATETNQTSRLGSRSRAIAVAVCAAMAAAVLGVVVFGAVSGPDPATSSDASAAPQAALPAPSALPVAPAPSATVSAAPLASASVTAAPPVGSAPPAVSSAPRAASPPATSAPQRPPALSSGPSRQPPPSKTSKPVDPLGI